MTSCGCFAGEKGTIGQVARTDGQDRSRQCRSESIERGDKERSHPGAAKSDPAAHHERPATDVIPIRHERRSNGSICAIVEPRMKDMRTQKRQPVNSPKAYHVPPSA